MVDYLNVNTVVVEAPRGLRVQGHCQLHVEVEARIGYEIACLKYQ